MYLKFDLHKHQGCPDTTVRASYCKQVIPYNRGKSLQIFNITFLCTNWGWDISLTSKSREGRDAKYLLAGHPCIFNDGKSR